ncbi:MAG: hypothetical protein PVS3B1_15240 [Ktedonobacteraceae bacterium]
MIQSVPQGMFYSKDMEKYEMLFYNLYHGKMVWVGRNGKVNVVNKM